MRQILLCYLFLSLFPKLAVAQITPDSSLGAESSVVESDGNNDTIEGGANRGDNLFHSFEDFNVKNGRDVNFANPEGVNNIFSRVTGNNISNIDGTLGVLGNANLYLINPNGMIFGENASLNVNGSFISTTADSVLFRNGREFSAANPNTSSLLTVDIPVGLQFRDNPGSIINQARSPQQAELNNQRNSNNSPAGLLVQPNQTLALIGGEIILEGGNLTAEGGNVELGSVGSHSLVGLEITESNIDFNYQAVETFSDITLTNRDGFAIFEEIQATEIPSVIDATTKETVGSINIQGKNVNILNGSQLLTATVENEPGGNLTINAAEQLTVSGSNLFFPGELEFSVVSGIFSSTVGDGNAGNINITTQRLLVENSATINSSSTQLFNFTTGELTTATGNAGDININASESIEISTEGSINSDTVGDGNGGTINITTQQLLVEDSATINSSSTFAVNFIINEIIPAQGDAGTININASESIEIYTEGSISSSTFGEDNAGNINLKTIDLILENKGVVSVSSGEEESNTLATGNAGAINIIETQSLSLDNSSEISAKTIQSNGDGGNIILQMSGNLELRNQSNISASAEGNGNGGNITINTKFLITSPQDNSDIIATAEEGDGGKIIINSFAIFGISPQDRITKFSDIFFSTSFSSSEQFNILNSNFLELKSEVVDTSQLIVQNVCQQTANSKFVNIGKGGLPENPNYTLNNNNIQVGLVSPIPRSEKVSLNEENIAITLENTQEETRKPPAQGWIRQENGLVELVAFNPDLSGEQRHFSDRNNCWQ